MRSFVNLVFLQLGIKIKRANGLKEKTIVNNQIRYHLYTTVAVRIVDDRH